MVQNLETATMKHETEDCILNQNRPKKGTQTEVTGTRMIHTRILCIKEIALEGGKISGNILSTIYLPIQRGNGDKNSMQKMYITPEFKKVIGRAVKQHLHIEVLQFSLLNRYVPHKWLVSKSFNYVIMLYCVYVLRIYFWKIFSVLMELGRIHATLLIYLCIF